MIALLPPLTSPHALRASASPTLSPRTAQLHPMNSTVASPALPTVASLTSFTSLAPPQVSSPSASTRCTRSQGLAPPLATTPFPLGSAMSSLPLSLPLLLPPFMLPLPSPRSTPPSHSSNSATSSPFRLTRGSMTPIMRLSRVLPASLSTPSQPPLPTALLILITLAPIAALSPRLMGLQAPMLWSLNHLPPPSALSRYGPRSACPTTRNNAPSRTGTPSLRVVLSSTEAQQLTMPFSSPPPLS